ncbi:MAG: DNA-directed RNA polymerase subunit omega [candidate division WS2 bacterium]|uniref:DNA-directed RNA polymerase subunit omega n=1 Tax=Psychracetigena formicireducens TaxID=2986056 RepID=A0A9E2F407_PSYF1|nr:DNA-directed RNA polymerase subunit omega [Candidatus Psychracetigena formicireducens]MBT9144506.1 DNA-directed RNA polymerase subunit omega [Candidatus Psychracetigena formicireducens]
MIKIPIEELLKKSKNNRFLLTILVAKRAAKIMEKQGIEGNISLLTREVDPVSQAIEDILADKSLIKPSTRDLSLPLSSDE